MTKTEIRQTDEGVIHTITSPSGIQYISQIDYKGQTLLALEVYDASGSFDLEYILFRDDLQTEHIKHAGEQYPTLIKDPHGEIFVSLEKETNGKRQAFISKLFQENGTGHGSIVKPFGEGHLGFIGNTGYYLTFFRLQRVDFEDGKITVHRNKIYKTYTKGILKGSYIHTLREEKEGVVIHEQLDRDCKAIFSRTFQVPEFEYLAILDLAIDGPSRLLAFRAGAKDVEIWTIDTYGNVEVQILFSLESEIGSLFDPVPLYSGAVLVYFTSENQNGWFLVKEGLLIECFVEKDTGYESLLDDRFIGLGSDDWILAGASATTGSGYSLTFYPSIEKFEPAVDKIILLTRSHR